MKKCTKCGIEKPLSEFTVRSDNGKYKGTCKPCVKIYSKNNYLKTLVKRKSQKLKKAYGISFPEKLAMFLHQNGKCEICGCQFKHIKLAHVDHCHSTGKVRGLLCGKCNPGIGFFDDSFDKLKSALAYLEKYNSKTYKK